MNNFVGNAKLTPYAKALRRNMTKEEKKLWYEFLCNLPCKVHRQYVIGKYIVDFCCLSKKLVIELDGSQHYEDTGIASDQERDAYLSELGYTVLRYSNLMVHQQFESVKVDIWNHLGL